MMEDTEVPVDVAMLDAPGQSPILMTPTPCLYLFKHLFGEPIARAPPSAAKPSHRRHDSLTNQSQSNQPNSDNAIWHTQVSIQQAINEGIDLNKLDELPVTHWRSTAHHKAFKLEQARIKQEAEQETFFNLDKYRYDFEVRANDSQGRLLRKYDPILAPDPDLELFESRRLPKYEDSDEEMADVDDRTDAPRRNGGYSNGGGGHSRNGGGRRFNNNYNNNGYQDGGNRGRKRGFREVDDDENHSHNNRGGRNDRNDDRRQKPRYTRPAAARLRDEILALSKLRNEVINGEKAIVSVTDKTREEECAAIGSDIAIEWEDDQVRGDLIDTMIQFMLEQPLKIPFVAAITLYANEKATEAMQEIGKRVAAKAQDMLDGGSWKEFKLLLRFLALTQSVWDGDGVWSLLDDLFDRAADFQEVSSSDAVGLELVQIILITIPYIIIAADDQQEKAQELLGKTAIIAEASTQHESREVVNPFPTDNDEKPFGFQSTIYLLQQQIQTEAENGWAFSCIPRLFNKSTKGAQNGADASNKIPFPTINIPSPAIPGESAFFPRTFFSIYAGQGIDTVPPPADIASSLLRDAVVDTIDVADYSRQEVARQLIDIDLYWAIGTFAPRGTKPDKLKDIPEGQSTWKPEDVALDGIFSQIFLLPAPAHKLVFYHSVVTEVCRIAPGDIAPCLGRAIRFLFNFSDILDYELVYRFLDWFSHHLSNFDFRWKWDEWTSVLEQPDFYPKKAFIIGILDKEIRLSFAKRIKQTLPGSYQPLITQGKMTEQPEYKYKDKSTPYSQEGNELLKLLRTKQPEEEIQVVIDKIEALATEQGIADPRVASTDAYMTAICFIGSKSTSHILAHIERCKDRLLRIGEHSEAGRAQIVQSVVDYWRDLPGTAVNIIDKLLNYGIVTPACVIKWAIGPDGIGNGAGLSESWRFEMVLATIKKVTGRVRIIAEHRAKVIPKTDPEDTEGFDADQIALIDQGLERERDDQMGSLFALINDLLTPTADGSSDALLAARDQSQGTTAATGFTDTDVSIVQNWAKRWIAVFARKQIVEMSIVGPAAVVVQTAVQGALRTLNERKRVEEVVRLEKIEREKAERREAEERERREKEEREREKEKMDVDGKDGLGDDLDVAADAEGIE